jgi:nucleoside-diphosphate-sugar epimerase
MDPVPLHLVTGGAGFIGSHLVQALTSRGDRVRVLDDLSSGRPENVEAARRGSRARGSSVEFLEGSITDPAMCRAACAGVECVFHEAAQVSVPRSIEDPELSYEINVMGTLRLLEAARRAGVRRFVFAASSAAYGNSATLPKVESMSPHPTSPYASGKLAAEHLLRVYGELHGMRTVALRYFNIFGPRQADDSPYTGVIALFARALLEGRRATIYGDGEQTRDFTYVDNAVQANLLAASAELEPGIVVNVGSGARVSVNALYREMAAMLGSELVPIYVESRSGDVRDSLASLERARACLGYSPSISWRDGLEMTVDWYRQRLSAAQR